MDVVNFLFPEFPGTIVEHQPHGRSIIARQPLSSHHHGICKSLLHGWCIVDFIKAFMEYTTSAHTELITPATISVKPDSQNNDILLELACTIYSSYDYGHMLLIWCFLSTLGIECSYDTSDWFVSLRTTYLLLNSLLTLV